MTGPALQLLALLLLAGAAPAQEAPPASQGNGTRPDLQQLIERLGHADWQEREAATRLLTRRGPEVLEPLRRRAAVERNPEIRRRLEYILDNLVPPSRAAVLVRVDEETGLLPGDVVTHLGAEPVRGQAELTQRLAAAPLGAYLRVLRHDGPHEFGPIAARDIVDARDYVAPRGERIAEAVRLYGAGLVERAHALLTELPSDTPDSEVSPLLRAVVAHTAGDGSRAMDLLAGRADAARPPRSRGADWTSPSALDLAVPAKAPFALEWELLSEGGRSLFDTQNEPDLRVQRVLIPARRYVDALGRAAELWTQFYRDGLGTSEEHNRTAGNQLAVCGWMLSDLGLLSECCRVIEPRSKILRQSGWGKWVRVETDAWLPFLAGEEKAALDLFYPDAIAILQNPPEPDDAIAVIQNPIIAARIAFFLYRQPEDPRVADALRIVGDDAHPFLREYTWWMLYALDSRNVELIRRHVRTLLPLLSDEAAGTFARAVALLEYAQEQPDDTVLAASRQRAFDAMSGVRRQQTLALLDALRALVAGRPADARAVLDPPWPEVEPLWHTARFLADPPPAAAAHEALSSPLLVVPWGQAGERWLVLARDHRLLEFDASTGRLRALAAPSASWFPNPLTWPWIGNEPATGRVWVYDRRRVIELAGDAGRDNLRFNLHTEDIPAFHRLLAHHFSRVAAALAGTPRTTERNGAFLASDVHANGEFVADPASPELAVVEALDRDPRVVHVGFRGGPQMLLDVEAGRAWDSLELQALAGLDAVPVFFPQALPPVENGGPEVLLMSGQGLLRFALRPGAIERIALPGAEAYPPLIPEWAPYDRRDPRFVYFARLPEDGGQVHRLALEDNSVERLDVANLALPEEYYDLMPRSRIRELLDTRLEQAGAPPLDAFIADAEQRVNDWSARMREPG